MFLYINIAVIFCVSLFSGLLPLFTGKYFMSNKLLSFCGQFSRGIFIAYGTLFLLPEALEHMHSHNLSSTFLVILLFFVFLAGFYLLENFSKFINIPKKQKIAWPILRYIILLPHALFEGITFGLRLTSPVFMVLFALSLHKIIELMMISLNLSAMDKLSESKKISMISILSLMTPLGMFFSNNKFLHGLEHSMTGVIIDILTAAAIVHIGIFCQMCLCRHSDQKTSKKKTYNNYYQPLLGLLAGGSLQLLLQLTGVASH